MGLDIKATHVPKWEKPLGYAEKVRLWECDKPRRRIHQELWDCIKPEKGKSEKARRWKILSHLQ